MIRVTVGSSSYAALTGLQSNASRLAALQAQLSSGDQITKPSDDPAGTVRALQLRADVKQNTQYASSASDAIAWMSTSDTAYSQVVTLAQQARTLTVQGLNSGSSTGSSADALAAQIDAIKTSMVALSNTTYNGRPVFGGTTAGAAAYQLNADGTVSYVGDGVDPGTGQSNPAFGGVVNRTVGSQNTVQVNQVGTDVFGAEGSDTNMFAVLSDISANLRSGNYTALSGDLDKMDTAIGQVSAAQATEGAAYQRVEIAQSVQSNNKLSLQTELSGIQDIDLADMAVKVSTAQVSYQASLQTTASIQQMSLLNFLN
ncbi:MAG TPA: flagellar hook-associated protein FlgL [Jatrophihabitantaceae bacterium]|jgi:flagellar hook-associated protein 3 FlgL|nr:flagellar hook-associated protein FlgL [Jatrophihabitantaceae bacterium]